MHKVHYLIVVGKYLPTYLFSAIIFESFCLTTKVQWFKRVNLCDVGHVVVIRKNLTKI